MLVVDNCISDELYLRVLSDESFFASDYEQDTQIAKGLNSYHGNRRKLSSYMFWPGWHKSDISTIKHQVIKEIWEYRLPVHISEVFGFEYWTRTFNEGQFIGEHVDEDTFAYQLTKTFYGSSIGCVWYGCENEQGGRLEIHKNPIPDGLTMALEPSRITEFFSQKEDRDTVDYKGNRLIVFDSGHLIHNTTPATSGPRQVMVINVWTRDLLPFGSAIGEFIYE